MLLVGVGVQPVRQLLDRPLDLGLQGPPPLALLPALAVSKQTLLLVPPGLLQALLKLRLEVLLFRRHRAGQQVVHIAALPPQQLPHGAHALDFQQLLVQLVQHLCVLRRLFPGQQHLLRGQRVYAGLVVRQLLLVVVQPPLPPGCRLGLLLVLGQKPPLQVVPRRGLQRVGQQLPVRDPRLPDGKFFLTISGRRAYTILRRSVDGRRSPSRRRSSFGDTPDGCRHCVCFFLEHKRRTVRHEDSVNIIPLSLCLSDHHSHIPTHSVDFNRCRKRDGPVPSALVVGFSVDFLSAFQHGRQCGVCRNFARAAQIAQTTVDVFGAEFNRVAIRPLDAVATCPEFRNRPLKPLFCGHSFNVGSNVFPRYDRHF